jgi:hypothetical protein
MAALIERRKSKHASEGASRSALQAGRLLKHELHPFTRSYPLAD